jgi:hypothetical protein
MTLRRDSAGDLVHNDVGDIVHCPCSYGRWGVDSGAAITEKAISLRVDSLGGVIYSAMPWPAVGIHDLYDVAASVLGFTSAPFVLSNTAGAVVDLSATPPTFAIPGKGILCEPSMWYTANWSISLDGHTYTETLRPPATPYEEFSGNIMERDETGFITNAHAAGMYVLENASRAIHRGNTPVKLTPDILRSVGFEQESPRGGGGGGGAGEDGHAATKERGGDGGKGIRTTFTGAVLWLGGGGGGAQRGRNAGQGGQGGGGNGADLVSLATSGEAHTGGGGGGAVGNTSAGSGGSGVCYVRVLVSAAILIKNQYGEEFSYTTVTDGGLSYHLYTFSSGAAIYVIGAVGGVVEYLLVGGGGGGSSGSLDGLTCGGGGGGGVLTGSFTLVTAPPVTECYSINIGAGGDGVGAPGSSGSNSVISRVTPEATAGVLATSYGGGAYITNGGSAPGQHAYGAVGTALVTPATILPGISGQGHAGGAAFSSRAPTDDQEWIMFIVPISGAASDYSLPMSKCPENAAFYFMATSILAVDGSTSYIDCDDWQVWCYKTAPIASSDSTYADWTYISSWHGFGVWLKTMHWPNITDPGVPPAALTKRYYYTATFDVWSMAWIVAINPGYNAPMTQGWPKWPETYMDGSTVFPGYDHVATGTDWAEVTAGCDANLYKMVIGLNPPAAPASPPTLYYPWDTQYTCPDGPWSTPTNWMGPQTCLTTSGWTITDMGSYGAYASCVTTSATAPSVPATIPDCTD